MPTVSLTCTSGLDCLVQSRASPPTRTSARRVTSSFTVMACSGPHYQRCVCACACVCVRVCVCVCVCVCRPARSRSRSTALQLLFIVVVLLLSGVDDRWEYWPWGWRDFRRRDRGVWGGELTWEEKAFFFWGIMADVARYHQRKRRASQSNR